jgi:GNAT superfamily N-acetyltransferase
VAGYLKLHRIRPDDRAKAVDLMQLLHISVGGIEDRTVHRAICSSREICCVVARDDNDLAGIAMVELNRNWIRRRPLLAARMLLNRLRHKRSPGEGAPQSPVVASPVPPAAAAPLRWSDAAPHVLFIGVHPDWRGKGVGKSLYQAIFDEIRVRGHNHIVARIATGNVASLRLHEETGWKLYNDDGVVLAIKDL